MMMGFFANNILPAHLGEFIRMYLGAKVLQVKNSQVLATIILERIFDILVTVWFLTFALIFIPKLPLIFTQIGIFAGAIGLLLVPLLVVSMAWGKFILKGVRKLLFLCPKTLAEKMTQQINLGISGFQAIKSPALLSGIVFTSVLQWLLMGICIYCSLLAVGIHEHYSVAILVLCCMVFAVTIPSAPGFFGVFQVAYLISLSPFGVKDDSALAASIFFHTLTFSSVTLLGFYLMHFMGMNIHKLQRVSGHADEEFNS